MDRTLILHFKDLQVDKVYSTDSPAGRALKPYLRRGQFCGTLKHEGSLILRKGDEAVCRCFDEG